MVPPDTTYSALPTKTLKKESKRKTAKRQVIQLKSLRKVKNILLKSELIN